MGGAHTQTARGTGVPSQPQLLNNDGKRGARGRGLTEPGRVGGSSPPTGHPPAACLQSVGWPRHPPACQGCTPSRSRAPASPAACGTQVQCSAASVQVHLCRQIELSVAAAAAAECTAFTFRLALGRRASVAGLRCCSSPQRPVRRPFGTHLNSSRSWPHSATASGLTKSRATLMEDRRLRTCGGGGAIYSSIV